MHPLLAQILAVQHMHAQHRPPSPEEQVVIDRLLVLEGQAIVLERMSASIDREHGNSVRADLSTEEIDAFTTRWSNQVLDTFLRAGVTSWEVRKALRTGELPDEGVVLSLAAFRHPE